MSQPPKFSFGNPAGSSGNNSSPFGAPPTTQASDTPGGLFGNAAKATTPTTNGFNFGGAASTGNNLFGGAASTGNSLFGNANSSGTPTSAGFSFGQKAPEKANNPTTPGVAPTANPFGAPTNNAGNLFGNNAAATPATNANKPALFSTTPAGPPPTNNLFGGAKPSGPAANLFGQKPEENKSDTPKSTPTFGAPLGGATGGGLFNQNQKAPEGSASSPFGSFGQKKDDQPASSAPAPSLFGKPAEDGANKPLFNLGGASSNTPAQSAPSSQPANTTTSAPTGGLFGGLGGAPSSTPPASSATPAPPLFGGAKKDETNKPAPLSLFGGAGQNKDDANKPAGGMFGNLGQKKDDAPKPAAPSGGMFGGLGQKKDDAAPANNLFGGLGQKKDEPAKDASSSAAAPASTTATSGTTPAFSLNKPAESSTPASTGTSAFSLKPTSTPAAPGATTPAAAPSSGTGGLGASTSGPTPPATSRLNSKSLDEIITVWTTSLSSHQKQFTNLATKIGSWDRMLVENSDKISKLYSRTFQAERDTAEVERQLATVEGQQEELSHWLDHYERVLDDMAAKAGGVESGVDAERERTYRTAERCSTRLTTMSHDLTSMIEEINLASTNLSKTSKATESDPLAQIVRVLNAHLGQLQQIDVGAEQLRQKVESAQKEVRGFGGRVGDEGGAEGFMRSLRR